VAVARVLFARVSLCLKRFSLLERVTGTCAFASELTFRVIESVLFAASDGAGLQEMMSS
jgi:hypothetical protein